MKTLVLTLVLWLLALLSPAHARSVFIGIDYSKSNPVVIDEKSAKVAAEYVGGIVAKLRPGDEIHILTFGDRSSAHAGGRTIRLGRKHKPEVVAYQIAKHIRELPTKPLEGSGETQIVAFLELTSFACDKNPLVILLTDGIESSPGMRERDTLAGKPLPSPEENILTGCSIVMTPFGRSKDGSISPSAVKAMRKSWSNWMTKAGVSSFTAITD